MRLILLYVVIITLFSADAVFPINNEKYVIGVWPNGFFSSFFSVLNHLDWCEKNNKVPVVYWDKQSLYYADYAGENVWEYYFEPVSNLCYEPFDVIHSSFTYGKGNAWYSSNVFAFWSRQQSMRDRAHYLIKKYVKLKLAIQQKIDQFYQENMANMNTIGIHIRGTDKSSEVPLVSPDYVIEAALVSADKNAQFLIATDEEKILNRMIELLKGHKVIFYDCYRSINGQPLHTIVSSTSPGTSSVSDKPQSRETLNEGRYRKPSSVTLGEDVLVEVMLLSKCNLLVHTLSNVSTGVLYFNPSIKNILLSEPLYNKQ